MELLLVIFLFASFTNAVALTPSEEPNFNQTMRAISSACRSHKPLPQEMRQWLRARFVGESEAKGAERRRDADRRLAQLERVIGADEGFHYLPGFSLSPTARQRAGFESTYHNYSAAAEAASEGNECPTAQSFAGSPGTLTFLGVDHLQFDTSPEEDAVKRAEFDLIAREIEKNRPDVIVLEGLPASLGPNPCASLGQNLLLSKAELSRATEHDFTIRQAIERNIPIVGAEPDEHDAIAHVSTHEKDSLFYPKLKVKPIDVFLFHRFQEFVALMPAPVLRNPKMLEKRYSQWLDFLDPSFFAEYHVPRSAIAYGPFLQWYFDHQVARDEKEARQTPSSEKERVALFHFLQAPSESLISESGPIEADPVEKTLFTRKLSVLISEQRNQNLHRVLTNFVDDGKRVMTVYGIGHLMMLRQALERSVGKASTPRSECEAPAVAKRPRELASH